jgi:hypothetical protein
MSILDNIGNNLDKDFENHAFLPQEITLQDLDRGISDFIKKLNLTVMDETGNSRAVPFVFNTQELWAERRANWKSMRSEYGEELTRPFMVLTRTSVKQGTSPLKRTIPVKKQFKWLKVPTFDGTLKGYVLYKIPQPTYVDVAYELVFVSTYVSDVNDYYTTLIRDAYSDLQGYMNINGYHISSRMEDPSETREDEMASERVYEVTIPIIVHGKLVDPTKFEKVNTINKIQIKISEKKSDK